MGREFQDEMQRFQTLEASHLDELRVLSAALGQNAVREIVNLFREKTPEHLATLRAALESGDLDGVGRIVHQLKGSTGYLGAQKMAFLCRQIEDAIRADNRERIELLLDFLDVASARALRAMEEKAGD